MVLYDPFRDLESLVVCGITWANEMNFFWMKHAKEVGSIS